jgi:hypothetical protein
VWRWRFRKGTALLSIVQSTLARSGLTCHAQSHKKYRFEGNTEGKAAIFGLLHTAGVDLPGQPGSLKLRFLQKFGHSFKIAGRSYSKEEDIPAWWTSKSRGADPNDA